MPHLSGGELFYELTKLQYFTEERTKFYTTQIICGLEYLHAHGFYYCDLKPEAFLLSAQGNIVFTWLGRISVPHKEQAKNGTTWSGSSEYLPPEVILGESRTFACDWWGLGMVIYEMITKIPPFYDEDIQRMYHKILEGELIRPINCSSQLWDLLQKLIVRDPQKRLQDPIQIKNHAWFDGVDWAAVERLEVQPEFVPPSKP